LLCLHNLLAGANERIYFKDADCRLLLVSDCYLAHLAGGRTLQEVIGKSDFDLFSGPHAVAAYEDEQRVMATGEPMFDKIERETFADRDDIWVCTSKLPLRDEQAGSSGPGASRATSLLSSAPSSCSQPTASWRPPTSASTGCCSS